jgi:hypothetical protein
VPITDKGRMIIQGARGIKKMKTGTQVLVNKFVNILFHESQTLDRKGTKPHGSLLSNIPYFTDH